MQIPVLIEPLANSGFRARSGEPLPLTVEAATRDEAVAKLQQMLQSKLQNGSELTTVDLVRQEHPFTRFIGTWSPDDPMIAEWKQAIEEYRRERDPEDAEQ